ncbi:cellobiose phosphorylase [Paenibacillus barcinonensis]|uniref:Cellobiose phosphorylase n=1 Tax=Paenibacillus barcinonensis TaxID=198119 RepID=A0A2V4WRI3_PAEBA|nr:cellobiose phosphorylase [Paenibacillus barcinonensis]PYE50754.1 cellobiose phosphorylase [Paenibacillus barcinonensis]QKS57434.1 cellobiose phosphorylase [Paenibacillus barcinonensis]
MATIMNETIRLTAGEVTFTFLNSGDLYQATSGTTMLNQLLGNPIDGSLNNLYLRVHEESGQITSYPLLGVHSNSRVSTSQSHGDRQLIWKGSVQPKHAAEAINYQVVFTLASQGIWFWDVKITGQQQRVDVVYGQDVGLADQGAVRSNEAYMSQYIDHTVFEDEAKGYVVCSRQNQPQGGVFPYMQQGSLTKAVGYSTDGFQFFGLSYKETNQPESLSYPSLANETYQYEFAYTALQSELVELNGEAQVVFYGLAKPNHATGITALEFGDEVAAAWNEVQALNAETGEVLEQVKLSSFLGEPLAALDLTQDEINELFPERHQEERSGDQLLSFFTGSYEHIVLKAKELLVERPHGHILMSGGNVKLGAHVITTTSYMYGMFNAQLVIGNTNLNKMISNARNALNVPKTAGQRIYVEVDGRYRLLTMPSLFEIGFNYARWIYKMESDTLIVTNYTTTHATEVRMNVRSASGKAYRYLVTNQITMNVNEYEYPLHMTQDDGTLIFKADPQAMSAGTYPELEYRMTVEGAVAQAGDETLLASGVRSGSASLVTLSLEESAEWTLKVQGVLENQAAEGADAAARSLSFEEEVQAYREFFAGVMNGFRLSRGESQDAEDLFKVNALAWWYTHNMLVHYSVPHGLEQYGGAAWGTRDVCQGPVEYFMATQKYEQVRDIIKMVYTHQYEDDGNWPQWFMFDKYFAIQQEESHGDIIVWPLKVLADYLTATRDYAILEEKVPYTVKHSFGFTEETATVLEHAKKEIEYIRAHFLHDTFLSSYGDGDWDDTLQPANAQLKQYMVSSWTVALTYQSVNVLSQALKAKDEAFAQELAALAEGIREDFNRYMLGTDVIPGFVYMEEADQAKLMLHPTDTETGIQYRLLPMTRSMIGELLNAEQAEAHYALIREQFLCPDGVRLMNRPAQYAGGVSTHFKRAEQASNFGREIGLQYVHAHIRYVEAMAKLGKTDQVWNGLAMINPVGIGEVVPNAEIRQANAYFSSSDGKFNTRYEAQEHFDQLRKGTVQVKGGWRIYSSGPGIYMNQLISNALGIRQEGGNLVIDPVLPAELDGMQFEFEYAGEPVTFIYHLSEGAVSRVAVNGKDVEGERTANRYRQGGVRIPLEVFKQARGAAERTVVDIYM